MQESLQQLKIIAITSCNDVLQGFDNNGVKKRSLPSISTENDSIQTKNCVAALSMMVSIVFGSFVRQVRPTLSY